ncbi:MAG: transketolase family protein, partial [Candidatus Omnitrophota bacterium]
QRKDIVVFDADLSGSTRTAFFQSQFPERFFNFGIAEQNMFAAASGMASCFKTVFVSTFAMFATGRAWDQVRNSICYSNLNVKIVATHAGITVGPDGATHQAIEDIALMRVIPNMKILVPCDGPQTKEAILLAAKISGPVYVRLGRPKVPTIGMYGDFAIGKSDVLTKGFDAAIFACGIMVKYALDAQKELLTQGIECSVINMYSLKPIDKEIIESMAKKVKGIVVCEEHSMIGGLGSAVASVVLEKGYAVPLKKIGINDRFGQSGELEDLLKEYLLQPEDIVAAVKKVLSMSAHTPSDL